MQLEKFNEHSYPNNMAMNTDESCKHSRIW